MNNPIKRLVVSLLFLTLGQLIASAIQPKIDLSSGKDRVLAKEKRETVLERGSFFVAEKDDAFVAEVEDISNPYGFKTPEVPQASVGARASEEAPVVAAPVVTYDDASVLEVVAMRFARQVRGSIARGSTSFLQIEGGALISPGTSFPVKIPQAKDQSFILLIPEITDDNYTLQIGEATKLMNYEANQSSPSSGVRFYD
jgi:hypothetical protein